MLGPGAGGADDWARGVADIPYTYTLELRPGKHGGFLATESDILESGEEVFAGLVALTNSI